MRTFIAIELPQEIKEKIGVFEKEIEKFLPLRFVSPKNLHLTLFFLGEIEEARIPEVVGAVKAGTREINKVCCSAIKPFYLFLGKPEFFTHGLWLNVEGQIEVLEKLYEQIKKELETRDFELETRPFSAHITIGRSKSKSKRFELREKIKGKFMVDSVAVFTSELTSEGPVYSKIKAISLE